MVSGILFVSGLGTRIQDLHVHVSYLDPNSMENSSPKPPKMAHKAIILHTFGFQVESKLRKEVGPLAHVVNGLLRPQGS